MVIVAYLFYFPLGQTARPQGVGAPLRAKVATVFIVLLQPRASSSWYFFEQRAQRFQCSGICSSSSRRYFVSLLTISRYSFDVIPALRMSRSNSSMVLDATALTSGLPQSMARIGFVATLTNLLDTRGVLIVRRRFFIASFAKPAFSFPIGFRELNHTTRMLKGAVLV